MVAALDASGAARSAPAADDEGRVAARALARARSRSWAYLRGAPGTLVYLFTLLVTWLTLSGVDDRLGHRLLVATSTNLDNMTRNPVQVLVTSAFWTGGSALVTSLTLVGFLVVMVPAERWLGTRRWLLTVAAGHLVATLLTVAATAYAINQDLVDARFAHGSDVGVSYGLLAAAGVLTYRLPRHRQRLAWAILLVLGLGLAAWLDGSITDLGHLVAFAVGLGLHPLTRHQRRVTNSTASSTSARV